MDLRRLRAGEVIAGFSGLVLLLALLVPWYSHDVATSFAGRLDLDSQNAFEALAVADLLLLVVALAAIGLAVTTSAEKTVAVPIAYATLLSAAGIVAVVVVLFHLGASPTPSEPVPSEVRGSVQTDSAAGLYLALLAAIGVLAGALLAMRDERLSRGSRPTDGTGRPLASVPEPELMAPPPPDAAR